MSCPLFKPYTNGRISLDVQSPCCPCQLKVKVTVKGQILNKQILDIMSCLLSITPLLMKGFSSNLNDTFTSTRGCAEPMLCHLRVKVTVKGQILNKQILDIKFYLLCKSYTNGKKSLILLSCPCVSSRSRSQLKVNYQLKVKVAIKGQIY